MLAESPRREFVVRQSFPLVRVCCDREPVGLAVELAVGSEREGLQEHEGRRHHVVGQLLLEKAAQLVGRRSRAVSRQRLRHQVLAPLESLREQTTACRTEGC